MMLLYEQWSHSPPGGAPEHISSLPAAEEEERRKPAAEQRAPYVFLRECFDTCSKALKADSEATKCD